MSTTPESSPRRSGFRLGSPALLLTLILVLMQIAGVISWPWWALLGPIWIPIAALIVLAVVLFILFCLGTGGTIVGAEALDLWDERKRAKRAAKSAAAEEGAS